MNNTAKWIVGLVVVALVIWGLVAANKNKNEDSSGNQTKSEETGPIKIGFIGPLTGENANLGLNAKAAAEIALEEVNNAGGVNGRKLEMIFEDGKCAGGPANSAATKLIDADKVSVILGGLCSGETMAFTQKAEDSKTAVLSYCSSNPSITNAGDYIFRVYPSDSFQGKFAAEYIYNKLGKKTVAILYTKNDWATGIKEVFSNSFKALGGSITADEGFDAASKDYRTVLSKIKATSPELLYFVGYTDSAIPGLKQAAELKLNIPMFGADGWDDPKIFTDAGAAGEGAMYSVVATAENQGFKQKMKEKTQSDSVIICSPGAYDGVKILADVMKKVGTDSTAIKNELYKVNYKGGALSDEISFDSNGDPKTANYIVKAAKNGKAEEVK